MRTFLATTEQSNSRERMLKREAVRPETIVLEVPSSVSTCAQKKAKQQCFFGEPRIPAARQKKKIHDFLPNEFAEFDATNRNAQKL